MDNTTTTINKSLLNDLENLRLTKLELKRNSVKYLLIAFILGVITILYLAKILVINYESFSIYFNFNHSYEYLKLPGYITVALCAVLYFIYKKPENDYINSYKNKVIPILLKDIGDFTFDPLSYIARDVFKKSKIAPSFSMIHGEDHIKGKIDDINLEFSELNLKKNSYYSKNRIPITVFKGAAIKLSMPFDFGSNIIIKNNGLKIDILNDFISKNKRVKLENTNFENQFDVYSDDYHNARYILSPAIMERILELKDSYLKSVGSTSLTCEFKGNSVLFMIYYSKNMLEPASINSSAHNLSKLDGVSAELKLIASIINQLKLDHMVLVKKAVDNIVEK